MKFLVKTIHFILIGLILGSLNLIRHLYKSYFAHKVMLGGMGFFQPVVAALVGLIPNCAASVLLTQLYVEGALRFSSLVAGLCTGAGVGLAVLWRANPSWKQNLFITGLTWAAGAFVGVAMQVVVAVFA